MFRARLSRRTSSATRRTNSDELTETLELKLVEPNAHKHCKHCETKRAYQDALEAAFTANCTTQSAANDVVVNYALSGYAKSALK